MKKTTVNPTAKTRTNATKTTTKKSTTKKPVVVEIAETVEPTETVTIEPTPTPQAADSQFATPNEAAEALRGVKTVEEFEAWAAKCPFSLIRRKDGARVVDMEPYGKDEVVALKLDNGKESYPFARVVAQCFDIQ